MNWAKGRPLDPRRPVRAALLLSVAIAAVPLCACSAQAQAGAGAGGDPAAVALKPASGSTSSTPTWSTSKACPSGFQGSAVFREVHHDGVSTNSISVGVAGVTGPFSGTLQASIAQIQAAGGIPNGGTQKLVVICFSGSSLTGTSHQEMNLFITYSRNGSTYKTSATAPAGS
jgi:hypothetical protein